MPKYLIKMSGPPKHAQRSHERASRGARCLGMISVLVLVGSSVAGEVWAERSKSSKRPSVAKSSGEFHDSDEEGLKIAQREYQAGLEDFKAERYRDALRRFNRVYRIKSHPNLVYNMARSFEQLNEYESAAIYYQRYLSLKPQSDDREQVSLTIETMKRLAAQKTSKATPKPVDRSGQRTLLWSGVATGGAMMIGGIFLGARALSLDQELSDTNYGNSVGRFDDTLSRRDRAALFADVLTISGAAITGVSLYFMLRSLGAPRPTATTRAQADAAQPSFQMILSPSSLTVSGAF